jgi:hypothetical protein
MNREMKTLLNHAQTNEIGVPPRMFSNKPSFDMLSSLDCKGERSRLSYNRLNIGKCEPSKLIPTIRLLT